MMKRALVLAAAALACLGAAEAQDTVAPARQTQALPRIGIPAADWLLFRPDRPMTFHPVVASGDTIMTMGVRHGRTARLMADAQLRTGIWGLGPRPAAMPAGLPFYKVPDLRSNLQFAGLRFDAWCTPNWSDAAGVGHPPMCLLYRQGGLATRDVQMIEPTFINPLMIYGATLNTSGAWGPRPQIEETDVQLPGEMTAQVTFLGVHGNNLAIRLTVSAHVDSYPNAGVTLEREAPILRDGSAYFPVGAGGSQSLQLRPVANSSNYEAILHGDLEPFVRQAQSAP